MAAGTLALAWMLLAAGTPPSDVWHINQRNIRIPIRPVDSAVRKEIRELILFSSTAEGKTWHQVAVAPPDQEVFPYYPPGDGLYWFTACAVFQTGPRDPADVYKVPPSQKLQIDTVKPVV